ncbi:hypothetical protein C7B82_09770 [Stenomitos frigidus ULC18]|uniref:Uncharacterized protein n=1 Tax=Stenomitos frigidus ULC18 TaxID=2107698 RepID=A0A2T1EBE2_9CYAN|nr:hypothetical protein C7B82_09770 [Stenomitos frigidus ULC18]
MVIVNARSAGMRKQTPLLFGGNTKMSTRSTEMSKQMLKTSKHMTFLLTETTETRKQIAV